MLALDRARVGPSFDDKALNSTELKQIQLDSLRLGYYIDPRHDARPHLSPTEWKKLELVQAGFRRCCRCPTDEYHSLHFIYCYLTRAVLTWTLAICFFSSISEEARPDLTALFECQAFNITITAWYGLVLE